MLPYPISPYVIPGLIRPKLKDAAEIMTCIEKAYNMPKGTIKNAKNITGYPLKNYCGVQLSEIRRALYVYLIYEVGMKSTHLAGLMGIDHSSVLKGATKGRVFVESKEVAFMPFYYFVKGIARGEDVALPGRKLGRVKGTGRRGNKPLLSREQQANVFDLWERNTSVHNLARTYGVSERTIHNVINRERDRLREAS